MASNKVWLVTGATSGIGLELAKAAIAAGHTVIAGCRDTAKNQVVTSELETLGVTWLQLDVGEDDVVARVQNAIAEHGHIDVLVNNAGYALAGAIEDTSIDQVKNQFNVNVLGPLRVIQAVLPSMRARKSGTIVNISSTNGIAALPSLGIYAASKFALEGLSEGLQTEVASFGIRVLLIEPGMIATRLADPKGSGVVVPISDAYKGTVVERTLEGILAAYAASMGASAEKTALRIVEAVDGKGFFEAKEINLRLPLGTDSAEKIRGKGNEYIDLCDGLKDVIGSIA